MAVDLTNVTVACTKPVGKTARLLAEMGIVLRPVEEDEGNVDRYFLSKRLAVERRSAGGFLMGIMDKTLFTSAIYLREHFRIPVLIVEGQVNFDYTLFSPEAIRGALSSMVILYGLNILTTPNTDETAGLIAMMARQEQLGIPEISLIPKRKATDLADTQRRVIEMLPGCGMVMARDLLQFFGSVERIVTATEDELRLLRGIGAKKARQMIRVLQAEYESVDTERHLEDAIEADATLLFKQPVVQIARQLYIFSDEGRRNFVDMVFLDPEADELILVELKRGRIARDHAAQLRRYLDQAAHCRMLAAFLDKGTRLRGLLATTEAAGHEPDADDLAVHIVDRKRAIAILKQLRERRLAQLEG